MLSYVQPTLDRAKSDGIIIHLGTNDLSAKKKRTCLFCCQIFLLHNICQDYYLAK